MEEIKKIKALLEEDRPVSWDNMPDIDLYMDQIISYLPRQSIGGRPPVITPAMVNNYVKDGRLPRASGKRYHREHLAYLTVIGLLKNVLTVKDMKVLLENQFPAGTEKEYYGKFLEQIDEAYTGVTGALDEDLSEDELAETALVFALASCASKAACEHLISVIRMREQEDEQKAKKDAPKKGKPEKKPLEESES